VLSIRADFRQRPPAQPERAARARPAAWEREPHKPLGKPRLLMESGNSQAGSASERGGTCFALNGETARLSLDGDRKIARSPHDFPVRSMTES
jgi:hypothetical protein